MRLSEAIRLGGMSTKQITGALSDGKGGTCALGGALLTVGVLDAYIHEIPNDDDLGIELTWISAFPTEAVLFASSFECPVCGQLGEFRETLSSLNDDHEWSREQIADYVEDLERMVVEKQAELNSKIPLASTPKVK